MNFSLLIIFFKKNLKSYLLFFIFILIYLATFFLYNLPLEALSYATLLCVTLGFIVSVISFISYKNKHDILIELQNSISITTDNLPSSSDLIEEDYQELIKVLFSEKSDLARSADSTNKEMLDYYTLWAHQIKTPIAAIQLLLQSSDTVSSNDLLSEVFKIEQYVGMVLQYIRLDSMSSDLLLKKYSLDNIVKQVVRKYAPLFIKKKIRLNFEDLNVSVLTDEKWLEFVLEQLLSNALKYTPEHGAVSIYMDKEKGKTLILSDTGIGISSDDLPRVIERGFTGYTGRDDKRATGIGLYLCKTILSKLSHTISIDSEVGSGTRVKLGLDNIEVNIE